MDVNLLHLLVTGVLTVVAGIITALVWKRAQVKTVFWWIGFTLVPAAVYLAGLAPAAQGAYDTLVQWWASLAFTPLQWAGLVLGCLATLLMLGSRLIPSESRRERREAAQAAKASESGSTARGQQSAPAPAPRPGITASPSTGKPAAPAAPPAAKGTGDEEFDEIAELLRKRGIN